MATPTARKIPAAGSTRTLARRAPPPATPPNNEPACTQLRVGAMADRLPFGPGETLEYSATLRGLPAGSVTLQVRDRATRNGKVVYPVHVSASGNPVVSLWARLNAEATSYLDPDGAVPLAFESTTRGDKMLYSEAVTFDHDQRRVDVRTTLNGKPQDMVATTEGDMVDALSLLFFARSRMVAVGQPFCMDLYQSRLVWRIRGRVSRMETLETDAGPFETYVAEGQATALGNVRGIAAQPRPFTAWMTNDEDRIPVRLDAPTPWGTITASLTRFEQGRRLVKSGPAR